MARVKDPVCGMEIDRALAEARATHEGKTYYFCSEECKKIFLDDPNECLKSAAEASSE
jgi:P-type Cu+ transporter